MEFRRRKFLSEGAKDAMVAKAMCRARVGHCQRGDGCRSLLQREAAPLSLFRCCCDLIGTLTERL